MGASSLSRYGYRRPRIRIAGPERVQLRAILDRPGTASMGLYPVVLAFGDELRIHGLTRGPTPISPSDLEQLLDGGHATQVDDVVDDNAVGPLCAFWVGRAFEHGADDADAPTLPFTRDELRAAGNHGRFRLDAPATVYAALDRWLRQAFVAAVDRGSREIAKLMNRVSPERTETRAALFITAPEDERNRYLSWWARHDRDAGLGEPGPDALIARIDAVCGATFLDWHGPSQSAMAPRAPWAEVALATRCAERMAPAIDPAPGDDRSPVARAIALARDAALTARPADRRRVEEVRRALLSVHRAWQEVRISSHILPSALHAVESALFGAERAPADPHTSQATDASIHGVAETMYPELTWRPLPSLWRHLAVAPRRAIAADSRALIPVTGPVPAAFFERPLWPDGEPTAWDDHLARFRARLFADETNEQIAHHNQ